MSKDSITYKDAGVDTEKAGAFLKGFGNYLKSRPSDPNLVAGVGGFAACYDLKSTLATMDHPLLVTCCDGVGTKVKLALEWDGLEGLGQDLVAMNVNDMICTGATPLMFLDYYACGELRESLLETLLMSIQRACELSECTLAGGETAEMPGVYDGKTFDLAGFSVGMVDKSHILGPQKVNPGDKLIAFASSGPHSNGYSLIRKIVERENLDPNQETPWKGGTWKDVLLAPTEIYVPHVKDCLNQFSALAHITGGGLFENLPRVLPEHVSARVHCSQWKFPPLFQWLGEKAGTEPKQWLSTFNCGVGMIGIAHPDQVPSLLQHLTSKGIEVWEVGEITDEAGAKILWE